MQRNTLIIFSNIINISHQFLRNNRYLLQILQQLSRRYFFFHSKIVSNTINIWNACSSVEYTIVKYQQEFFSLKIDLHTRGTKSGRERDYSADVIISREKNEKKDRERERERVNDILIESFDFVACSNTKLCSLSLFSNRHRVFFRVRWHRNSLI